MTIAGVGRFYRRKSGALAFQIGVDPLFEFAAAFVGGVEANAERVLGFFPGDGGANPETGQREQRERNFDLLAGADGLDASDRHAAGTDFDAGGGELSGFADLHGDLGDHRDAHVAAEFVQNQRVGGANEFQRCGTLHGILKDGIDAVFGVAHGFLGAAADAVDHHAAVRGRGARGFHHGLRGGAQLHNAGFKFFLAQALGGVAVDHHGFNAELAKAFGEDFFGAILEVDHGDAGARFFGRNDGGQSSA